MVRLADLPPQQAKAWSEIAVPVFDTDVAAPPTRLAGSRIAIVSTAGLVRRGERPFAGGDTDFREIPDSLPAGDLLQSHISINFDRSGFLEDANVVLPRDRLREMAAAGEIGAVAARHFSFMGATDPLKMRDHAAQVVGQLRQDRVDAVLLSPV